MNLLSNATKFQQEGLIEIYTTIHFDDDEQFIEITLKDNGPGMTMAQLMDVFNPVKRDINTPS